MTANTTDTLEALPFDLLVWRPVDSGSTDGPRMAILWGDPARGAFGALLRVPAGFESPMHTHSRDERVIQLRGSSIHWNRGETRKTAAVMKPGDYMRMPGGVAHVSATPEGEESLEFITMNGPFDFTITALDSEVKQ
ncbi:MAG: cupin domain-containing protein [Acidimicrobiia bacterium]